MVSLRDGRKLIGVLRSWDQFGMYILQSRCHGANEYPANLVLQSTVERIFVPPSYNTSVPPEAHLQIDAPVPPGLYADIPRGIFLVRGENVLLLGEIDLDKDDDSPPGYEKGEVELVTKLDKIRKAREVKKEKSRTKKLAELGFEGETTAEAII